MIFWFIFWFIKSKHVYLSPETDELQRNVHGAGFFARLLTQFLATLTGQPAPANESIHRPLNSQTISEALPEATSAILLGPAEI